MVIEDIGRRMTTRVPCRRPLRHCAAVLSLLAMSMSPSAAAEPDVSPIRFNQHAFAPRGMKTFAVTAAAAGTRWRVRDRGGRVVATGRLPALTADADADAGEDVALVRIKAALPPGTYRLEVGTLAARPFTVIERPNRALFRDAMSFFYQQRAGAPILARWVQRPDLARAAGHAPEVVGCFAGQDERGVRWPGCAGRTDVTGGWYDAGDRGKYVVNAGISVWTLLTTFERAARHGAQAIVADGALALPDAGNGVPDLLDEARYEIEWMLRMQLPAGTSAAVVENGAVRRIDGGGLVFQKVADTAWAPVPIRPADDHRERALYPPTTAATLNLAAVAAQCARVWRTIDPAFAARCLAASTRAFAAASAHPALLADNRFTGSGGYGDTKLDDEFFWAAAELATTTGDPAYVEAVRRSRFAQEGATAAPGWADVAMAGTITLATVPGAVPRAVADAQRRAIVVVADRYLLDDRRQGYGFPGGLGRTGWGSNGDLLDRAVVLGTAADLTGDARYRDAVVDALDYVLGRNPLDRSYVSGYGARPMRNPHHRFWAHQADPSYPLPPPGVLSGGPNSSSMSDDIARGMKGKCRPQTCWVDDYRAFTQNEVAINWNAPLVWVAGFLDDAG
jgi:endoglucanase